jgi:hypothetical protein
VRDFSQIRAKSLHAWSKGSKGSKAGISRTPPPPHSNINELEYRRGSMFGGEKKKHALMCRYR